MSAKCQKRTYALQVFGNNQEGSRALSEAERQLADKEDEAAGPAITGRQLIFDHR
jgi:hypothetical protein